MPDAAPDVLGNTNGRSVEAAGVGLVPEAERVVVGGGVVRAVVEAGTVAAVLLRGGVVVLRVEAGVAAGGRCVGVAAAAEEGPSGAARGAFDGAVVVGAGIVADASWVSGAMLLSVGSGVSGAAGAG